MNVTIVQFTGAFYCNERLESRVWDWETSVTSYIVWAFVVDQIECFGSLI